MQWRVKSQSGQAAIEYILLLIISVALVLALMTQFFKPLQTFISAYMGDYTACLLRTGELPSLGNSDAKSALSDQGCNAKFQPASWAGGRPSTATGGASTGSGSGGKDSSDSSSTASSGGGSGGRGGGGGANYFGTPKGSRSGDAAGANKKVVEIALDNGGANGFFKTSSGGAAAYRPDKKLSIGLSGMTESEKKKLEKKALGNSRVVASDGPGVTPKKNIVKKPDKKVEIEEEEQPFTIGSFMRMLFIIAIILAIVIFVGGQVLQMSKSYDK